MDNQSNKSPNQINEKNTPGRANSTAEKDKIWNKTHLSEKPFVPDPEKAWIKFQQKINDREKALQSNWYWKVAAAISLLIAGSLLVWNYSYEPVEKMNIASTEDSVKMITLADGSQVWLNASSSIKYPENFKNNREITLSGEAFFEVAKMNGQPFTVLTDALKITVLGTSFNVNEAEAGEVKVQVATGKVAVEPRFKNKASNQILLTPGEETILSKTAPEQVIKKKSIEDQNFRAWQNQILVFNNQSLIEIVSKLSKHYDRVIDLDPSLSSCRFTTKFDHQSLEEALEILSLTGDLVITYSQNQIKIEGTPCK
jgi:transmembrane sensor